VVSYRNASGKWATCDMSMVAMTAESQSLCHAGHMRSHTAVVDAPTPVFAHNAHIRRASGSEHVMPIHAGHASSCFTCQMSTNQASPRHACQALTYLSMHCSAAVPESNQD
jgi:hypothetical protein